MYVIHIGYNSEENDNPYLEGYYVLTKFQDVFPREISGLDVRRYINFTIESMPGFAPVSKALYWMSTLNLTELEMYLQDSLDMKHIRTSLSP